MDTTDNVELVIILERIKHRTISRSYPTWLGKTFKVSKVKFDHYLAVKRELKDLEDQFIEEAIEQGAYIRPKDIQYHLRKLQEGEVHKFNDDGTVTIKSND